MVTVALLYPKHLPKQHDCASKIRHSTHSLPSPSRMQAACVQIISTCGAASWAPRLVGVKQRPALQLARPVPGLVTDRRAVDNGREKQRKQRKIVVPFLLRGRDSMGFQHPLAKSNPMSWALLPLNSSADSAIPRDIVFHQAVLHLYDNQARVATLCSDPSCNSERVTAWQMLH